MTQQTPGPPHLGAHPLATTSPYRTIVDSFGKPMPPKDDPAWQAPTDPLTDKSVRDFTIYREIPITVVQTGWDIAMVRMALENLVQGMFDAPAQLVDSVIGDSRVQSCFQSRAGGLLGRPLNFKIPKAYKNSALAKECCDAWEEHWPTMAAESTLIDMLMWGCSMGFWTGQCLWDTSGDYWKPYLHTWHNKHTYYHWLFRRYIAITLDGQTPIFPGNGHWVMHAPYGQYRGWMKGAVRPIAPWWLARNYALRDWARYSERHGMPIGKAITPFGADVKQIQQFRADVAALGQETIIQLPQSPDPQIGQYDFNWLETKDRSWDGFEGLIQQCNAEITLAVLGQNLTSEVKEGSFAAARVHADVRQAIVESDARALAQTIYTQIARPFAAINFGNPELAPRVEWDIVPYEDNKVKADTMSAVAMAINTLRTALIKVENVDAFFKSLGLMLTTSELEEPEENEEDAVPGQAEAPGNIGNRPESP